MSKKCIVPSQKVSTVNFRFLSKLLNLSRIDTIGTSHYNVGKFLSKLLNPLTLNEYSLSDSFQAVSDIKNIPKELFSEGYSLISFDVVSLFTNVPLSKTVQIVLDRVYNHNFVSTTLTKRTLKKLILDSCMY